MITVTTKDGATLGSIGEADLQILIDQFEEESSSDREYYVCEPTIALLEEAGASPDFVAMLRRAAGSDGVDIVWHRG